MWLSNLLKWWRLFKKRVVHPRLDVYICSHDCIVPFFVLFCFFVFVFWFVPLFCSIVLVFFWVFFACLFYLLFDSFLFVLNIWNFANFKTHKGILFKLLICKFVSHAVTKYPFLYKDPVDFGFSIIMFRFGLACVFIPEPM